MGISNATVDRRVAIPLLFPDRIGIYKRCFWRRVENQRIWTRITLRARTRTNNLLNSHIKFEPGPH